MKFSSNRLVQNGNNKPVFECCFHALLLPVSKGAAALFNYSMYLFVFLIDDVNSLKIIHF